MMQRIPSATGKKRWAGHWIAAQCSALLLIACDHSTAPQQPLEVIHEKPALPVVRVMIADKISRVRIQSPTPFTVTADSGTINVLKPGNRWLTVSANPSGVLQIDGKEIASAGVTITPKPDQSMSVASAEHEQENWQESQDYYGAMRLESTDAAGIRIVNMVPLERYVECVVAAEVWPTFAPEAFRGQAIIARTYVLYQMQRRKGDAYDVAATQGAQMYRGIRRDGTGRKAAEAARITRGKVCAWWSDGAYHLFSTYYSSACGGMSQSAAIFGEADDITPLAGGVPCKYCRNAPGDSYRWGPTQLSAEEVLRHLVARYPDLSALERIVDIVPSEATSFGRPVRLELIGSSGATEEMLAERFRVAVGPEVMHSTDCQIQVEHGEVIFTQGRGFGHGLGLCQWGMQGQALAGKKAEEILRYYYPGSKVLPIDKITSPS